MNAVQQFYELVAIEYSRIEQLKQEAKERGEIAVNLVNALVRGEIDSATYEQLRWEIFGV